MSSMVQRGSPLLMHARIVFFKLLSKLVQMYMLFLSEDTKISEAS